MSREPSSVGKGLKKGAWTAEEDKKLISYIHKHGEGGWRDIPQKIGLKRCGKGCRLRWANYLKPDIKRGGFSYEEEQIIILLHASQGNKWSVIARHLPKRTDNEVKNYWNTHLKKRLIDQGIDPLTHKPFVSNPSPATSKTSDSKADSNPIQSCSTSPKSLVHSSNPPEISSSDETPGNDGSLSPKKRRFKRSTSMSNLLNKVATRAASVRSIISASMERTLNRSITLSPCVGDKFSENSQNHVDEFDLFLQPPNHIVDQTKDDISMNIDDFNNSEYDFSQFIEQFSNTEGQEAAEIINGGYNEDQLHISNVSSIIVDGDNIMPNINGWSNYFDHSDFYDPVIGYRT